MSVAKLSKLFIISHKSDTEAVLKKLQEIPITIEVQPYTEKMEFEMPVSDTVPLYDTKVKRALNILDDYKTEKLKKIASKAGKLVVKKSEYERIIENVNFEEIVDGIMDIEEEIGNLDSRAADLKPKTLLLKKWSFYKGNIEDIGAGDTYTVRLGEIRTEKQDFAQFAKELNEKKISYEKLHKDGDANYVILAYHNHYKEDAEEYLRSISFEEPDLSGYRGTIEGNLNRIHKIMTRDGKRRECLVAEVKNMICEYERPLTIYLDYIENNLDIQNAIKSGFSTEYVSFHTAWVKKSDKKKVIDVIKSFKSTRVVEVKPGKDEKIPIVLENKPLFEPFEIIVDLYGVPRYFEIDPTPFVSLFFAMFFGLCLTDAGYGVIMAALTLIFAFRMKSMKKFLMLIFFGSIFTIFAGAVFNGWFGDLPKYLGIDAFFEKIAILGDPISTNQGSMNFFKLALILGVVHVIFGLCIKVYDCLKRKDWEGAFFDGFPWIIIIIPLIIMLLSTQMAVNLQLVSQPIFSSVISKFLIWPVVLGAVVIILFSARDEKSWGFRLFIGFLNLTIVNGLTSFLGDFLSYIRLMALGLVTAGIGVAINKIAFQFLSIPVAGIVLLIIVLLFGHLFNIGINMLGGFVHTLRLQYVEFFPKFYVGGGRPIRTLSDKHKYITIVD
jgi:V/A-type H+-transporting ATPase subunit I